eukprot:7123058-Heterocapsa_arctica.AAC.1
MDETLLAKNGLISPTRTTASRALHDTFIDFVKLQFEQSSSSPVEDQAVKRAARAKDGRLRRLLQGPA